MNFTAFSKIVISSLIVGGVLYCYSVPLAGNKEMVEQNVQELDELNKQAVKQIPDLPRSGKVKMKADVTYEKDSPVFDIRYKEITGEKEGAINFGDNEDNESQRREKVKNNDEQNN
jgi:hypothetical protein